MKDKIAELKLRHRVAETQAEKSAIDSEMKRLLDRDPDAFASAMLKLVKESADEVEAINLRELFREVAPAISLAHVAKVYFGKTREWLYQRLNGYVVNGKPAQFSEEELNTLRDALCDIEKKLSLLRASL